MNIHEERVKSGFSSKALSAAESQGEIKAGKYRVYVVNFKQLALNKASLSLSYSYGTDKFENPKRFQHSQDYHPFLDSCP